MANHKADWFTFLDIACAWKYGALVPVLSHASKCCQVPCKDVIANANPAN